MANIFSTLEALTPHIQQMDAGTNVLDLSKFTGQAIITINNWDNMRTDQTVYLYLNNDNIQLQTVQQDPVTHEFFIEPFYIDTTQFKLGHNSLYYLVIANNGAEDENKGYSKTLEFDVIKDSLTASLKIDITKGAAGYTDMYPSLMPANIAVVRGPANTKLQARSSGAVRFQEAGGADTCIFELDNNGQSPIVLIRIDQLNAMDAAATADDRLIITKINEIDELKSEAVVFGEYELLQGDAAKEFNSVSFNNIGISDGITPSIVSIILTDDNKNNSIKIKLDNKLNYKDNTINKAAAVLDPNGYHVVPVIDNTAEFAVTTSAAENYTIFIMSITNSDIIFELQMEFLMLQ